VPDAAALVTDATVIRSLLEGEGIVDLRPAGEPVTVGARLWLQAGGPPAELKPAYRALATLSPPPGDAAVSGWAEVAGAGTVHLDAKAVEALNGKTVIQVDAMAGQEVQVVALRAHRLAEPVAGDRLPADPAGTTSEPALSDGAFEAKLASVAESVPGFRR
jgi:hypothetical protein